MCLNFGPYSSSASLLHDSFLLNKLQVHQPMHAKPHRNGTTRLKQRHGSINDATAWTAASSIQVVLASKHLGKALAHSTLSFKSSPPHPRRVFAPASSSPMISIFSSGSPKKCLLLTTFWMFCWMKSSMRPLNVWSSAYIRMPAIKRTDPIPGTDRGIWAGNGVGGTVGGE